MRRRGVWALAAGCIGCPLAAAQVTPIYDFSFFAGQNFFEGTATGLGGNVDLVATPVVKFSDQWSLFPTYQGTYRGTRDVQELAGGGTLFQDSTSQSVLVKGVRTIGPLKLKPSVGGRVEWLRETVDEDWGEGLFDYRKVSGGLEGEYAFSRTVGGRLSYDYYQLAFPNYTSLESAQDPTLSRELVGEDVLNNANHMATIGFWAPLPGRGRADISFLYNQRAYGDQPVVAPSGDLTATDRADAAFALSAGLSRGFRGPGNTPVVGELALGFSQQDSNQNHYDARKAVFSENYYDFSEWRIGPRMTAGLAQGRWLVSLGANYTRREYDQRPAQDANGDFLPEPLAVSNLVAQLGVGYPLSKNMRLRLETSLGWSEANTDYEKVFRYNYRTANYLFGFSYDY